MLIHADRWLYFLESLSESDLGFQHERIFLPEKEKKGKELKELETDNFLTIPIYKIYLLNK